MELAQALGLADGFAQEAPASNGWRAEPAWVTVVVVGDVHNQSQENAKFVPRNRRWYVDEPA